MRNDSSEIGAYTEREVELQILKRNAKYHLPMPTQPPSGIVWGIAPIQMA